MQALIRTADEVGFEATVLKAVEERNRTQKSTLFEKASDWFGGRLAGKVFALWGLAFKPDTNDMREAPARVLMEALWRAGATVRAFDPEAMHECRAIYGERDGLVLCDTKEAALYGADALLIATEWKSFRAPDFDEIREALSTPVVFDGRNLYDPQMVARHGLDYVSIGRPAGRARQSAMRRGLAA